MKCPLCSNEIVSLTGPYEIHQPNIHGKEESGDLKVCGRCFMLVSINENLKSILEELRYGRPR